MCHRIKFHKKSLERRPRYGNFYIFQDGSRRHVGFLKFYIFNGRKGQEGQSASVCQISSKSFELWPIFRLLNMDFEKVGMIRIRLLFRTIRQDHVHFGFRSMCERGEIRRCYRRSGWVWRWCSGVARKRQTKVAMDILCVKKEAKLSARVIPGVEEGNGEEDLRCKS